MKILELALNNFKAFQSFKLEPQGESITVTGDNATGKTTLRDGFYYGLIGKDSSGSADFEIKTLGQDGAPIRMLDHSVDVVIEHNGRVQSFRRVFAESWVKPRGSHTASFSGHKTTYYLDGVPVQKKEFDAAVAALCSEELLRILSDPTYFASKLSWQDRRRLLLDMCGDLADTEVIDSNAALADLPNVLVGRSIAAHRKVIAARKAIINNELKAIPVRVDEASRTVPESVNEETGVCPTCGRKLTKNNKGKAREAVFEARISELKLQEETLAAEYVELDRQTFLTEEFMRTKVRLLEDKINSRFELARFRLFEQQINGALVETCEVLGADLVPYNKGLNNAARINTGIDIINTISKHYGITTPIFVDNAEAVTQLIDTPAQLIRLVVSEADKKLRVEKEVA